MLTLDGRGDPPDPSAIARAADLLRKGEVVALPTDTVYGLAADPSRPGAVSRLFGIKGRPREVAVPVLVASRGQVTAVAGDLDVAAAALASRYWPGPLTLVVPRAAGFTVDLGGPRSARDTVGVRWPAHPVVVALCAEVGPLAVTSANRHGEPPAQTAGEVAEQLGGPRRSGGSGSGGGPAVAAVLDGGRGSGIASTVVECRGTDVRVLRDGGVPVAAVMAEVRTEGPETGGRRTVLTAPRGPGDTGR